jgi:hypothetical protein
MADSADSVLARCASLVLLDAGAFGSAATAYGLTKLFLYDYCQRLPVCRRLCLLEYP